VQKHQSVKQEEVKETPVISALRERIKLHSLRAVARELGVSPHTITAWIKKKNVPKKYFKDGDLVGKEAAVNILSRPPRKSAQKSECL
jgi:DNA invertase Pin-like site-specific DNA recombinase